MNNLFSGDYLKEYQITAIEVDNTLSSLKVNLTGGGLKDKPNAILELYNLVFLTLSKDPQDNEGCYLILESKVEWLDLAQAKSILNRKGFHFKNYTFHFEKLLYLYVEGDICFDLICSNYKLFE